ncbi:MAG: hypothetical protein ACYC5K_01395 [Saccharofermentanales bacterium]|jgi:hypothetical protein
MMDNATIEYIHRRIIADATLKVDGGEELTIGRDAVMNITGKYFVILCGGKEIFREPHKQIEVYRMQSGNGMEFIHSTPRGGRKVLRVHFVQDVKTPRWHDQTR